MHFSATVRSYEGSRSLETIKTNHNFPTIPKLRRILETPDYTIIAILTRHCFCRLLKKTQRRGAHFRFSCSWPVFVKRARSRITSTSEVFFISSPLKVQCVRRKELLHLNLLFRQPLFVEVVHQRGNHMTILLEAVGPWIIAQNLLLLLHRTTEPGQ